MTIFMDSMLPLRCDSYGIAAQRFRGMESAIR